MSTSVTTPEQYPFDQIEIRLDAKGPIELGALGESFSALSSAFDAFLLRQNLGGVGMPPVRLCIEAIDRGSIVASIKPYLILLSEPIAWMAATNTLVTFTKTFTGWLKYFSGDPTAEAAPPDASASLQAVLKPLTGRRSAELGIKHLRFHQKDGQRETILELKMDASSINLAANNLQRTLDEQRLLSLTSSNHRIHSEVTMKLFQTNEGPGREKGRTGDRAIIPSVSDKDLPLYFPKQSNEFKRQILERTENPFQKHYIVDVDVEYIDDAPRIYRLIHLHQIIDP